MSNESKCVVGEKGPEIFKPKMSPFAFEIGQLVRLEDREGQVTARTDYGHREPGYCVQCMMLKTFGPSGSICTSTRGISESELLKLQPPEMISLADAKEMWVEARRLGISETSEIFRKAKEDRAARRRARRTARAKSRKRR